MSKLRLSETEQWRRFDEFVGHTVEVPEELDEYVDDSVRDVCLQLPATVFTDLRDLGNTHSMGVHDFVRHLIDEALAAEADGRAKRRITRRRPNAAG